MIEMLHLKQFEGSPPYNMLGGTSERICKRKQSCVWNVQLYSSAENERDSTYIIQNQIRKRNWESGIQPTCTQYENGLYLKISRHQLSISWSQLSVYWLR
jgi:hypothetical protein